MKTGGIQKNSDFKKTTLRVLNLISFLCFGGALVDSLGGALVDSLGSALVDSLGVALVESTDEPPNRIDIGGEYHAEWGEVSLSVGVQESMG